MSDSGLDLLLMRSHFDPVATLGIQVRISPVASPDDCFKSSHRSRERGADNTFSVSSLCFCWCLRGKVSDSTSEYQSDVVSVGRLDSVVLLLPELMTNLAFRRKWHVCSFIKSQDGPRFSDKANQILCWILIGLHRLQFRCVSEKERDKENSVNANKRSSKILLQERTVLAFNSSVLTVEFASTDCTLHVFFHKKPSLF